MFEYVAPEYELEGFNCPNCNAFAHQKWYNEVKAESVYYMNHHRHENCNKIIKSIQISICEKCKNYSLWINGKMVYPNKSNAPLPIEEMPEEVKIIYNEASDIVNLSPRAACGLLRLATETLLNYLNIDGETLDQKIGTLVSDGLPSKIQKGLDSLRVIGNESLHDGQMDLMDTYNDAEILFNIMNIIVETQIVIPNQINDVYESLPENKREGIENRDRNSNSS